MEGEDRKEDALKLYIQAKEVISEDVTAESLTTAIKLLSKAVKLYPSQKYESRLNKLKVGY